MSKFYGGRWEGEGSIRGRIGGSLKASERQVTTNWGSDIIEKERVHGNKDGRVGGGKVKARKLLMVIGRGSLYSRRRRGRRRMSA